eukprot:scaffold274466_cov33-Tisochrysis_lutea.AAC.1
MSSREDSKIARSRMRTGCVPAEPARSCARPADGGARACGGGLAALSLLSHSLLLALGLGWAVRPVTVRAALQPPSLRAARSTRALLPGGGGQRP